VKRPVSVARRHPRLRVERGCVARAVRALDAAAASLGGGCPPGELSVAFVTDAALAGLHMRFLGDPSPTDVITFGSAGPGSAGEICASADAAARRAGGGRAGFSRELSLYLVHGWLHLAGYDDRDPRSRRAMRSAEARAMRLLARAGAMPRFELV
jgi:probable rRNA maturation factor